MNRKSDVIISKKEYNTIHQWRLRNYKKTGVCEHCGETAKTQWANKTGNYLRDDNDDWLELCARCHGDFDKRGMFTVRYDQDRPTGKYCNICEVDRLEHPGNKHIVYRV